MTRPMAPEEAQSLLDAPSGRVLGNISRRALQSVATVGRVVDLLDVLADDRDKDAAGLKKIGVNGDYVEGRRDGYRKAIHLLREYLGDNPEHPEAPPNAGGASSRKEND